MYVIYYLLLLLNGVPGQPADDFSYHIMGELLHSSQIKIIELNLSVRAFNEYCPRVMLLTFNSKGISMSLQKLKELEDLKSQAAEILKKMKVVFSSHRASTNKNLLAEMRKHLESQGFTTTINNGKNRGFVATYKSLKITAESSPDDETYFQSDYVITLTSGSKTADLELIVSRFPVPDAPQNGDIDTLINDYKTNYLPQLESASEVSLDNNYELLLRVTNTGISNKKTIINGSHAIDEFCALLH